ncbi:hypothetical protein [Pseudoduganella violacea]|uniref:Uncharacterized protein n=1 Tax=Pseudoduganella violacea TaxID=1715466 RepID=A0A7W5BF81_9BURK|nr:hypothetical protein [Pseudoduganella violacea]MBB3121795.1 hypothetical protein [Pseudoduganella violacea]
MGFEYKLSFQSPGGESTIGALARLPGARLPANQAGTIEFRRGAPDSGMPDATASATAYGLYFCDHGGFGREYLGYIAAQLIHAFGAITIEELE